jgi:hypothetical protein
MASTINGSRHGHAKRHSDGKRTVTRPVDKEAVASRLSALTGGSCPIKFEPTDAAVGDPESKGHFFSGCLDPFETNEEEFLCLDDRLDLEQQLIDELQRVGRIYFKLAADVAAKCGRPAPRVSDVAKQLKSNVAS